VSWEAVAATAGVLGAVVGILAGVVIRSFGAGRWVGTMNHHATEIRHLREQGDRFKDQVEGSLTDVRRECLDLLIRHTEAVTNRLDEGSKTLGRLEGQIQGVKDRVGGIEEILRDGWHPPAG